MRSYPRNSPEAAARIVALIMVADGHVSRSETAALDRLHASTLLDIAPADMARVLRELSEDLMCTAYAPWGSACRIGDELLRALLSEVDDPELRATTLGHVVRGAPPTAFDRLLATRLGVAALMSLADGVAGVLVGEQRGEITPTPLAENAGRTKPISTDLIELARVLAQKAAVRAL